MLCIDTVHRQKDQYVDDLPEGFVMRIQGYYSTYFGDDVDSTKQNRFCFVSFLFLAISKVLHCLKTVLRTKPSSNVTGSTRTFLVPCCKRLLPFVHVKVHMKKCIHLNLDLLPVVFRFRIMTFFYLFRVHIQLENDIRFPSKETIFSPNGSWSVS